MPQTPGDDNDEPSLELPTLKLPGLGRRRRKEQSATGYVEPDTAPTTVESEPPRTTVGSEPPPSTVVPETIAVPATPRRGPRPRRSRPAAPGPVAAGLTGLLVGAAGAAGTLGAMAGCEAVRGVSTCGGAPGFFILVALLALMILLGAGVLKALGVGDGGSTSFLAVGVVAVIAMLVLLDVIFSPWMFLVIPLLGAAAYLMAYWVTTRFEGETSDTLRR
jgi:hypothetical protein